METVLSLAVAASPPMNMLSGVGERQRKREGEIDNAEHGGKSELEKRARGTGGSEGGARMKWPLRFLSSTEKERQRD